MNAMLTDLPRAHWQQLIDWAGQVCTAGATLTVRGGALHAQGPPELLTPEIMAALRRYEPAFVRLLLRADTAAVAWRVAAMLDALSCSPAVWTNLKARPGLVARPGRCRACADCARTIQPLDGRQTYEPVRQPSDPKSDAPASDASEPPDSCGRSGVGVVAVWPLTLENAGNCWSAHRCCRDAGVRPRRASGRPRRRRRRRSRRRRPGRDGAPARSAGRSA